MANNDAAQRQKFERMTTAPVEPLICKLAIPTILSMLVTTFYNMADTYFIGQLENTSATGAVGVIFPLMNIIQAIGFFCGHGSGNYISRALGRRDTDDAARMAATGFFGAILCGLIVAVLGLLFTAPLVQLFGATETILPYAADYARYILAAAPFMCAALAVNNQLRFQGNALYGSIGILSGAVLNIALDPLLIFTCNMGVAGAALATGISQCVALLLLLVGMRRSDSVHIRLKLFTPTWKYIKGITTGGVPSLCRQGIASLSSTLLNHIAGLLTGNDAAIAAMGIVSRVMMFANSVTIGFGQGFQPVCGFNYGAGLYSRVRRAFSFCVKVAFVFLLAVGCIAFFLAPQLISAFQSDDPAVVDIGTRALRLQLLTLPLMSWVIMSNMCLQTIGKSVQASLLALSRQGLTFIPSLIVLTLAAGLEGFLWAQPVADVLALALALPLQLLEMRRMRRIGDRPTE